MVIQQTTWWRTAITTFCLMVLVASATTAQAQHRFTRGDNAPGVAGRNALLARPSLNGYLQPVRIIVPQGAMVGMYTGQEDPVTLSEMSVGLMVGHPYRVKVSDIPRREGAEIFPSIELLDRLYPPAGLEADFPVHVVLTQDDLEQAIRGKMVTKVVYVEDPRTAMPVQQQLRDDAPYVEVNASTEPVAVAEQLGRPIAIVRLGSRIPVAAEAGSPHFTFLAPLTEPLSMPAPFVPDAQFYEQFNGFQNRMNDTTVSPQGALYGPQPGYRQYAPVFAPSADVSGHAPASSGAAPRVATMTEDFQRIPAPVAPTPPVIHSLDFPQSGGTIRR